MVGPPEAADVSLPAPRASAHPSGGDGDAPVRFFLIADVRGYTSFTDRFGDEATGRLAARFADATRGVVEAFGGRLVELRGDEALVVFGSPRAAVRAALALQDRYIEDTLADPSLPLTVGIGLDAGEAVAVEGGYRGAALNLAARLQAQAVAGEVLASLEVTHLAGRMDGVRFEPRGRVSMKGMAAPVPVVRVVAEHADPAREAAFRKAVAAPSLHRSASSRWRWVAASTAFLVIVGLGAVALSRRSGTPVALPPGGIAMVDAGSGRLTGAAPVGHRPGAMAADGGDVWVVQSDTDTVARLDRDSGIVVQTVSVGRSPVAVAVTHKDVWVANSGEGTVTLISTANNQPLDTIAVGNLPVAVAAGFGSVWVANRGDGTVSRISTSSGYVVGDPIPVGDGPQGLAVGAGAVWVANGRDNTVTSIDPDTGIVGSPVSVGAGPQGMTFADHDLWVANSLEQSVSRIDPGLRQQVDIMQVGDLPSTVSTVGDSVWVANEGTGTLNAIDARVGRTNGSLVLHASPAGLAVVGHALWVATRPFAGAHKGGTLTVVGDVPEVIDPSDVNFFFTRVDANLYDGLLGYRRTGGVFGYDLVPDLAETIPRPTDGGTAYTFVLRRGIRYSDGRPVVPGDIRRGLERIFTTLKATSADAYGISYFSGIHGARACLATPGHCDLSRGVETGRRTVTIHLDSPDPDFLANLGLTYAVAVPPGTPDHTATPDSPIPGTGPYRIAAFEPKKSLVLERNPYFRQWSAAAQPEGYPDRLVWSKGSTAAGIADVTHGRADLVELDELPPEAAEQLRHKYPTRMHDTGIAGTHYAVLADRYPFDRPLARRAVAFAIDRAAIARWFSSYPTCQVVPHDFPGYSPYCPYTVNPDSSGEWHGPDVARAKALVRRSGTLHARVDVNIYKDQPFLRFARLLVRELKELGYRVHLHATEDYQVLGTKGEVAGFLWTADLPAASNYELMSCHVVVGCPASTERLARQARQEQVVDPGRAQRTWQEFFRRVVREAAWVPANDLSERTFVSKRLHNYQVSPLLIGPILDQMWIR